MIGNHASRLDELIELVAAIVVGYAARGDTRAVAAHAHALFEMRREADGRQTATTIRTAAFVLEQHAVQRLSVSIAPTAATRVFKTITKIKTK